jgi:glycosyltransferase involved in cell wall biosynthesis
VIVRRNPERLGYGANFLEAAKLATEDLIAFCDQDDVWYPHKLERAIDLMQESGAGMLVHVADIVDDSGARRGAFTQSIRHDQTLPPLTHNPWGVFYGCTMVFRRELFEVLDVGERGPHTFEYDQLLSHDLWMQFLASSLSSIVMCTEPLIAYRQHGTNATPSIVGRSFRRWTSSLGRAADPRLARDRTAQHRADLLGRTSTRPDLPEHIRAAAERAAERWRHIAAIERSRLDMYSKRGIATRVSITAALVRKGAYRRASAGGLGPRLLLKDLVAGVLRLRRERLTRISTR